MNIPDFVKPFLWSYDTSKFDKEKHKGVLILNILDFGTLKAIDWLFKQYGKEEIKKEFENSLVTEYSKKSLNYWSLIFNTTPRKSRLD